jgi:hypothetical protein
MATDVEYYSVCNMSVADAFVLWIGAQEVIAGLLYLWSGKPWNAVAWLAYGCACVGLAMAGK